MKSVTAAILIHEGRILIARRRAGDRLEFKWEFPGGKIEEGETPQECLQREMNEEFGIEVSVGKYLWESVYHYKHGSIKLMAYQTFWKRGNLLPSVHDDFRWVTLQELGDYDFAPADIPFVEKLSACGSVATVAGNA